MELVPEEALDVSGKEDKEEREKKKRKKKMIRKCMDGQFTLFFCQMIKEDGAHATAAITELLLIFPRKKNSAGQPAHAL